MHGRKDADVLGQGINSGDRALNLGQVEKWDLEGPNRKIGNEKMKRLEMPMRLKKMQKACEWRQEWSFED